jgi:hypothetical protein
MKIIGCDFHPSYQQIAVLDLATGETEEKALSHERRRKCGPFTRDWKGLYEWGSKPAGSRSSKGRPFIMRFTGLGMQCILAL